MILMVKVSIELQRVRLRAQDGVNRPSGSSHPSY